MQLKEVGFDPLLGLGGSAWMIERELTFTVFVTTLYAMPRSKAVGQSGFLVQLLRRFERGGEMQRLFYDAIMTDFATASLPASWSHVVYALLIKPPPSDASIVAERREIAIMEQRMKVVMQSVRRSVYSHMPPHGGSSTLSLVGSRGCPLPTWASSLLSQCSRRL